MVLTVSCSQYQTKQKEIVVTERNPQIQVLIPPRPLQIASPEDIHFNVVTTENKEEKLLENEGVLLCTSWEDYLEIGKFNQSILRWMKESNSIMDYYEQTTRERNGK